MSLTITQLPDFPLGLKNGVGALHSRQLFAGMGSAGKRFFRLDLDSVSEGWNECTEFPGTERNDALMIADETGLWVFSGAGRPEGSHSAQVLTDVYHYCMNGDSWEKVDTDIPIGLLGASGGEISPGKFVFFGGYNKPIFDSFVAKISDINPTEEPVKHHELLVEFMSRTPEEYHWNQDVLLFDSNSLTWHVLMGNPFPANCGASLIQDSSRVILVDGEIKPGLRSTQVKQFTFHSLSDIDVSILPSIVGQGLEHEGVAGAYSGVLNNQYFVAGGAYFIGSLQRLRERQWYTHQGLVKHYNNQVWRFDGLRWLEAGELPVGSAYGVSITTDKGIVILGGEDNKGSGLTNCFVMNWNNF